jgi:hypothetical protein
MAITGKAEPIAPRLTTLPDDRETETKFEVPPVEVNEANPSLETAEPPRRVL